MGAPIRPAEEVSTIINKGQHALADLGLELINSEKEGVDSSSVTHRAKMYRLVLLMIYLQNILDPDGNVRDFYSSSQNEKKFNKILDAIAKLSYLYGGSAIPIIVGGNNPLIFYPSTAGESVVSPGSTDIPYFENLDIDTPSEVVAEYTIGSRGFALFVYEAYGSNSGEGSRSGIIVVNIRNGSATIFELKTSENGGITSPLTFTVQVSSGKLQLIANVSTNNWIVKGIRLM